MIANRAGEHLNSAGPQTDRRVCERAGPAKVMLLRGQEGDGGFSMRRYANELESALRANAGDRWRFADYQIEPLKIVGRLIGGAGTWIDSGITRYLHYPMRAARLDADLFHILTHGYSQLVMALGARKTIVTCHDVIPLLSMRGLIPRTSKKRVSLTFMLRMRVMARAACVIADSELTRRDLCTFLPRVAERTVVVHPGLSPAFRPGNDPDAIAGLRRSLEIPEAARVVLSVCGRKKRYKNVPAILRALRILNDQPAGPVWLVHVGEGFFDDEASLMAELNLTGRVIQAGSPRSDEALRAFYQAADVLAFPSWHEGFGWPPLEAMACGTPVVASNAGSIPEVVGNAALMVAPGDFKALAASIASLFDDADRRAGMVSRGLQRAAQFSWDRAACMVLGIYERVLQSGASA